MARPDNILIVLPLIIASYWDYAALKDRDKRKFIIRRIRRTFALFIFPTIGFFTYRYLYFGKVLPYNWLHHSLETDKQFGIFNFEAYNFLKTLSALLHFTFSNWCDLLLLKNAKK